MFKNNLLKTLKFKTQSLYFNTVKHFTGKTETGWKFTTPTMKMKSITPIFPPPGDSLEIPSNIYLFIQNGH